MEVRVGTWYISQAIGNEALHCHVEYGRINDIQTGEALQELQSYRRLILPYLPVEISALDIIYHSKNCKQETRIR